MVTLARIIYWFLWLNLVSLLAIAFKRDALHQVIRNKKSIRLFTSAQLFALVLNLFVNYQDYKVLVESVPETQQVEFLKWQKDCHKVERDMYLSLATGLSCLSIYLIAYYNDKLQRYAKYR